MAKVGEKVVASVAFQMSELALAVETRHFRSRTPDEEKWAKEEISNRIHARIRSAAVRGARQIVVDGPESDFVVEAGTPFVRGGMAAIMGYLRAEGFKVTILNRYAGHAYGQYGLEVTW
jgi:hypothetical protein